MLPSALRSCGVVGAVDVGELGDGCVLGDAVEHAAGADRGELLAVADGDQLRSRALHELGEGVEALVVDHPGLVEEHRRVPADAHGARVRAGDQRVQGERASGKRGAVGAESLGGGAGYGYADRVAAGELLCACGGVDHDALAGPGGADENRDPLGPGESSSAWCCSGLRGPAMRSATSRGRGSGVTSPTSRPAGWASWVTRRSIACSWARTARVVIRPPSKLRTRRSRTISRAIPSASSGAISPAACSSTTLRRSRS